RRRPLLPAGDRRPEGVGAAGAGVSLQHAGRRDGGRLLHAVRLPQRHPPRSGGMTITRAMPMIHETFGPSASFHGTFGSSARRTAVALLLLAWPVGSPLPGGGVAAAQEAAVAEAPPETMGEVTLD